VSALPIVSGEDYDSLGSFSVALAEDCSSLAPIVREPAYMGDLLGRLLEVEAQKGKTYRVFSPQLPFDNSYVGRFRNAVVADRLCTLRTEEGLYVRESLTSGEYEKDIARSSANEPATAAGKAGYLIGSWLVGNYYHWIFQALPSLEYLDRLGVPDCRIVMAEPSAWQLRGLELAGAPLDRLDIIRQGEARLYESLYYPFFARGQYHGFRPGLREFYGRMRDRAKRSGGGDLLLYASRRRIGARPLLNEPLLEEQLTARGFEVVCPETVSIDKQIDLFSRARLIVAPHGSALTNLVFCRPGTILYELLPVHHVRPGSFKVSQYFGLEYHGDCFKPYPRYGHGGWLAKLPRVLERVDQLIERARAFALTADR
jgi:hypothetical protein